MAELLEGVASDLERATPPLHHDFLVENEVTADECFAVSETAGHILRGFLRASPKVKQKVLLLGILGEKEAEEIADFAERAVDEQHIHEELGALFDELSEDSSGSE